MKSGFWGWMARLWRKRHKTCHIFSMAMKRHPLLEPRVLAAVGLVALGGGLGIGLMLARVLITIGFSLSIVSAVGVIWLYLEHLSSAYRALTGKGKYKGPRALELLIALGMAVALIALSADVFSIVLIESPSASRARLQLANFSRLKYPNMQSPAVNIQISNTGALNSDKTTLLAVGFLRNGFLLKEQIEAEFMEMSKVADEMEKRGIYNHGQIPPGSGAIITLESINPDQWPLIVAGKKVAGDSVLLFSDEQWRSFQGGLLNLYVIYFARYKDENLKDGYWEESFCGYFTVTASYWHNCYGNEIRRMIGVRQ